MVGIIFLKQYKNDAMTTSAPSNEWVVSISDADVTTYAPFNMLTVHNLSNEYIDIRFGGSTTKIRTIPPKTTLDIPKEENLLYYGLSVYNQSTTGNDIAANQIIIEVAKFGTHGRYPRWR